MLGPRKISLQQTHAFFESLTAHSLFALRRGLFFGDAEFALKFAYDVFVVTSFFLIDSLKFIFNVNYRMGEKKLFEYKKVHESLVKNVLAPCFYFTSKINHQENLLPIDDRLMD
jgi:hypothetical protein